MKIAIQGHPTRGKEVIQILENLGGKNKLGFTGDSYVSHYLIDEYKNIYAFSIYIPNGYKCYTLEEFEKEFPFKIGDTAYFDNHPFVIEGITEHESNPAYRGYLVKLGPAIIETTVLTKMKEERNITLTLDKAKEWYKKGGELKEVALQAYSEEELAKIELPKTWEEFCRRYPVQNGESWVGGQDTIYTAILKSSDRKYKNWTPSKKSAEAHLAMIQLEQLRDCWRQGWVPDWLDGNKKKYSIKNWRDGSVVEITYTTHSFLSFQTYELAFEFEKTFKDLIKQAGDLI